VESPQITQMLQILPVFYHNDQRDQRYLRANYS
jgi:hypothetical protein